ncbi:hypothetical protein PMZ80_006512 [Knufia obscura]|uniref:Dienelactone hydrolase domain-containing protein n=2 Tax=Knufia TaxID=430999 RepID=A0AAN8I5U7_9EURO|nr:hypothetical protein PMZ80_006512 [Knufia obscura]KAK5950871.1 hypothetical protein OHC33_007942 [Knufia fluminis]
MSCPDCFQGAIMADYTPKGSTTTLHNRQTYIAKPPNNETPRGIIIIISDAFGQSFPNNKHLADTYAAAGPYLVYLPDFMDGHAAPSWMVYTFPAILKTDTWWDWVVKPYHVACALYGFAPFFYYNSFAKSMPKVTAFFEAVRENEAKEMNLPIGDAGFCWGGQHTFALASGEYKTKGGQVLCDAHFTAHPSNVSVPGDAKKVKLPLSVAAAGKDKVMTVEQAREVEAILREKTEKEGLKHSEVVYYMEAGHGFGVRADPGNEKVKKHADGSVQQAVRFWNRVFDEWKPAS